MKSLQRVLRVCLGLACLLCIPVLFAQDSTTVPAAGSGVVLPLLSQLAQASASGVTFETNVTGSNAALQAFCAGTTSVVGSTRTISAEEDSLCQQNGVQYMELLVGHNIATFIANPADAFVTCLTLSDLDTLFAPSSTVANWTGVNPSYTDQPLQIFVPAGDTVTAALLDSLVRGEGLRADVQVRTPGEIVTAVASTPGALGVVDLQTAQSAVGSVIILQTNTNPDDLTATCASPDSFGVENNVYGASQSLYLYVNRTETERLKTFLDFVVSDLSTPVIAEAGFTPPSPNAYSINQQVAAGALSGRVFSKGSVSFSIPPELAGEVNISGSGALFSFLKGAADTLTQTHPNFKATFNVDGQAAALRRLCSGQSDAALITGAMTAEQEQACTANNVALVSIPLGKQAVVLVGHEGDTFSQCLTRAQILTVWGAASTDTVENWNQVDASFPDQAMTLFGISEGSATSELLLNQPGQPAQIIRVDTEINADPLYRAAAVANVPGALTYMTWSEYQSVVANNQARIQLVQVDGGAGCVTPSLETIENGTYPLATSYTLLIAQNRLSKPEVQSYLWTLFTDENYSPISGLGLIGFDALSLSSVRETLQVEFTNAAEAAAEPGAEATVSPDATLEAPVDGTAEAPVATSDATVEATSAATAEATTAATAEAPVATVEATAEAPVATAEATAN